MIARAVLDASAAVRLVLGSDHAREIGDALAEAVIVLTPDLFCSEVTNSLLKYVRHGDLSVEEATLRLEEALALIDNMVASRALAQEALSTAAKRTDSAYDMMYAILARRSGATVITMDRNFALRLREMDLEVFCPLLREAHRVQGPAPEPVRLASGEGPIAPEARRSPASAASPPVARAPRAAPGELYNDVVAALSTVSAEFTKDDILRVLGRSPNRVALFRVLQKLEFEGRIEVQSLGIGRQPTVYRKKDEEPAGDRK